MMTIPRASPPVRKKLVACSSISNFNGGAVVESATKNSNTFGMNPQLAIERSLKNDLRISGIGRVMKTMRLIIYITSTNSQNVAGFNMKPAPPDPAPAPPDALPNTADVKPIAPALLVITEADSTISVTFIDTLESRVTLSSYSSNYLSSRSTIIV